MSIPDFVMSHRHQPDVGRALSAANPRGCRCLRWPTRQLPITAFVQCDLNIYPVHVSEISELKGLAHRFFSAWPVGHRVVGQSIPHPHKLRFHGLHVESMLGGLASSESFCQVHIASSARPRIPSIEWVDW